jgi:hypothetical protein
MFSAFVADIEHDREGRHCLNRTGSQVVSLQRHQKKATQSSFLCWLIPIGFSDATKNGRPKYFST